MKCGERPLSGSYGALTFTNGLATVRLRNNESVKITGIPVGTTYAVTEAEDKSFDASATGASGTISAGTGKATFVNTRRTGDLTIAKTVISPVPAEHERTYAFTVRMKTLEGKPVSGVYGNNTFDRNGALTVTLMGDQSMTLSGLPVGVRYTVAEDAEKNFDTTTEDASGTIVAEGQTAKFINTRRTGELTVSKTVINRIRKDDDTRFAFTVSLRDETLTGVFGDMTFKDGVATFELKGGETLKATGLLQGVGYTVTESGRKGYENTAVSGDEGVIGAEPSEASFENTYSAYGSVVIHGEKRLVNRGFSKADSLVISVSGDGKLPQYTWIKVNLPAGKRTAAFSFAEIVYGLEDMDGAREKTYTYTFTERAGMEDTEEDAGTHTATVRLTDDGEGRLVPEVTYSDRDGVCFTNTYQGPPEPMATSRAYCPNT